MSNKDEIDQAADALRDSVSTGAAANVDDILSEIIGGDGSYSPGYHRMFSKYDARSAASTTEEATGRDGGAFPRRDYGAEADAAIAAGKKVEESISRKIAPSVRGAVARESQDTPRPEFTVDGSVRYPTRGVGESGERVVYDADWEEEAREEAARISQRVGGAPQSASAAPAGQFRFTGAEEPPRRTSPERDAGKPAETAKNPPSRAAGETAPAPAAEKPAPPSYFPEDFDAPQPAPAQPQKKAAPAQEPEEQRGLSPETQKTVDSAVLEAFSSDFGGDEAFKARWADSVEKAARRKEQKAKEAQEEEAKKRAEKQLEERQRRVAEMEKSMDQNPPPAQKGTFTPPPPPAPKITPAEVPAAERLDEATALKAQSGVNAAAESTIKKTGGEKFSFFMKTHFSKEGFKRFCRNTFPAKGDGGKEIFRKLVRIVSFIALVCALVYLAFYYRNYRARINTDNEMGDNLIDPPSLSESEMADTWESLKARYPDVDFPEGMNVKFGEYYAMNPDTAGYLYIEEQGDTPEAKKDYRIKTVLMQNTANEDFYLYHDFYKNYSRYGNPYVMRGCNMGPEGLSKNTVIYGHNTHDHMMFHRLEDYLTVSGYLSAPIITLDTLYETTKWKIFAVMLTNADPADDNGYVFDYLYSSFSSDSSFIYKMNQIKARSVIHTGVDVEPGDKTLMLYTCYRYRFDSGRLVIVARQLREGESEEINSSLVYYDSSAILPAAYYTGTPTTAAETTTGKDKEETKEGGSAAENTDAVTDAPPVSETPVSTDAPEEPAPSESEALPAEPTAGETPTEAPASDAASGEEAAGA